MFVDHPGEKRRPDGERLTLDLARKSSDFHEFSPYEEDAGFLRIAYYRSLVAAEKVTHFLLPTLQKHRDRLQRPDDLRGILPFAEVTLTNAEKEAVAKIMEGFVLLRMGSAEGVYVLANLDNSQMGQRQSNDTENEFSVVGPKSGFVENLDTNLHLLRAKLPTPELIIETLTIGSHSKTKVAVVYLENVANPEYVQAMKQRLEDFDFEVLYDTSQLEEILADNSNTLFPLFLSSERIDRITYAITSGQVAVFSNGSPYAMAAPANFLGFFVSPEDYYLPWVLGSFFRFIRLLSVMFSIFATPIYVAVMTFHYEIIPESMLGPLIESRIHVPFPPVVEVIFLEITIDLLREAGARLPSKIGQTLGIVGGIVIGEASVQAALTSNILLIIVALSALASFTTPIFKMANTIRLLRFPFVLLAAFWGGLGITAGFLMLMGHLIRLKSLGTPYFVPLFPFRKGNLDDSVIRASYQYSSHRSLFLRPLSAFRYHPRSRKEDGDVE
ncbi:MAG: spore germination protein [Paenibacillus sp.]|uniref:spore germination protein n=1 Tax=Paenibacillus sp. TaxID=58172 RepID=UPI002904FED6|nr:spore germination protein [Paenibacillus sp.]MDU2242916.1 spore germination protein [Paenibacillus sp.]